MVAQKGDTNIFYDIIIIGGGVSGFSAAMYSGRLAMKPLLFGDLMGGIITTTDEVSNYPGFKKLTGIELADKIKEHAEEFANKGVHYCALCDSFAYKNKVTAIIGGSDTAAKDALVLAQAGKKVYMIYRGETIRPEHVNLIKIENMIKKGKIEIINNTNVVEIKGDSNGVTHIILDKYYKGSKEFQLDGVFIAIGHIALSDLAKDLGVKLNKKGEIKINRNSETNVPGVYAAGDVGDTAFKQAITGVAEAVLASYSAYEHISKM